MSYAIGQPVLWPLPPNWASPVMESLGWLTDVQVSRNATQQKRQLRLLPRRTFGFSVVANDDDRRLVDSLGFDQGARQVVLPIYPDVQTLASAQPAASTSVPCTTDGFDFADGGQAVLWASANQWELLAIDTVGAGVLTLSVATASDWPAGTRLYPARTARLVNPVRFKAYTDTLAEADVQLQLDEPCSWPAVLPATTYRGVAVLELRPDESDPASIQYDRALQTVDNTTGPVEYFDFVALGLRAQPHNWNLFGRAAHSSFRSLMYALAGRAGQLWVPSWRADLVLASPSSAAFSTITVRWCGYTVFSREQVNRRDIRIALADGTVLYRRITGAAEFGITEALTLDAALGVDVAPVDVVMISFLAMCQLASDTVQIAHITDADGVAQASTPWQAVKHDV